MAQPEGPGQIGSGCYTLELVHECDHSLLTSVPRAYILTLHETATFPHLHGVARRTYVQRNRSFKACRKSLAHDRVVASTNQDLIHAYDRVLTEEEGRGAPFLIFEDDAKLTEAAREDLPQVDLFVSTQEFSVYYLGCSGVFKLPYGSEGHWRLFGAVAYTHAIVYSPSAPSAILKIIRSGLRPKDHIDIPVLSKLPNRFTYYRPIAFQPFDDSNRSENSKTWGLDANFTFFLNDVLYGGLHSEEGWRVMYRVHKWCVPLIGCVALLLATSAALLISRKLR